MPNSNQLSGAEAMVNMLNLYKVKHVFGLCGDTTLPFYDALFRLDHGIEHILTRDERSAAYMADGYARITKKVGVCEGPSGGGATYILPGLIEAQESSIPILAITSDVSTRSKGHYPLTELDQERLMRPITKFNSLIQHADAVPSTVRAAFRHMTTGRPGSAHLGFPIDVQNGESNSDDIWADLAHTHYPAHPYGPDSEAVEAVINAIHSAKFPIIICGGGVLLSGGEAELQKLSEQLDIAVATTVSGQGTIPENHSNCLGVVGSNGGVPETRDALQLADLVVFIGCRAGSVTTEKWQIPSRKTRIIHIDCDPAVIGATYPTEVSLVSDARLALQSLNHSLTREKNHHKFGGAVAIAPFVKQKWSRFHKIAESNNIPIRPETTIQALRKVLDDDAIVVGDPGTPCPYISAYYQIRKAGRHVFSNRAHGALGYALPAAIGAAIGAPDKKVVALMGDGSFGFTCGELETVVRKKLPITFIVFSNSSYGWIKAGQQSGFEKRFYSVDFTRTDHRKVGEAFGLSAWQVSEPEQLESVFRNAINRPEPTLIDIISQNLNEADAPVSEWIA